LPSLAGTVWVYRWRDRDYAFAFGEAGDIGLLESWAGVRWRAVGPALVVLDGPGGDQMVLRFDEALRTFQTTDWDGQPATGRRAD
jgi:hypothetical protein